MLLLKKDYMSRTDLAIVQIHTVHFELFGVFEKIKLGLGGRLAAVKNQKPD
jgi:hypothetical protein